MMDKDQLISKFLSKSLSKKESEIFHKLLDTDIAFKEEVHLLQNLQKVTEFEDDSQARDMVAEFEKEHTRKKVSSKRAIWYAAASIILLVGLSYFIWPKNADTQELFAQNFEPYRNVVYPISRASQEEDLATQAFRSYEKGDYKNALELFESLHGDTQTPYYLFYKANVFLELDRPNEAIEALQLYLRTEDVLTEKTYWYLAMAYLRLNDIENAKKSLRKVVHENKYNVKKAKSLLKVLD